MYEKKTKKKVDIKFIERKLNYLYSLTLCLPKKKYLYS